MTPTRLAAAPLLALAVCMGAASPVAAQVPDHLQCYRISDPLKLDGIVDVASAQFGAATGCKISRASLFCVPATKAVVAVEDRATGTPIVPLSFWAPPAPGDRVCYKARCPSPYPPAQQITDQFGTRTLTRFRSTLLCTPAVKGPTPDADAFHAFPATGQTTCWNSAGAIIACAGTGHDGDIQGGSTLAYLDNGDGTITDLNTGLTWEKKSDDGSIHDKDTVYAWSNAFAVHVAGLNAMSFAGHTDWRVPSAKELQSIVDYEQGSPSVDVPFNNGCVPGCTVLTCSCTKGPDHWTSTTNVNLASYAWSVNFSGGVVSPGDKTVGNLVRAVRGGA